jgi:hypothetical protein
MLKESGELDVLLPDLLLAMNLDPLVRPSTGSRQHGVDVPAVGIDPDDPAAGRKLFLFTVKRGNIGRADWNSGIQSVRPSLDEILDTYLRVMVRPEHKDLPKKIVLVTGGDMRPDVTVDWNSYVDVNRCRYPQYGSVEFGFWGGDALAGLLEEHLFDEFMFPESARKQIRKTIAIADQAEDEPEHFYALVRDSFFERKPPIGTSAADIKARRRAFQLIELSLLVVFRWCEEAGNLRTAYLAAERTLLTTWDWMRQSGLLECRTTLGRFARLRGVHRKILSAFAEKIRGHAKVRDGLMVPDDIEYALRVFETVGLLGTLVCSFVFEASEARSSEEADAHLAAAADGADILAGVVANNPAAYLPRFDGHVIDVGIGLLALQLAGPPNAASRWLDRIAIRMMTAVKMKRHFPVSSDSYEDLLALRGPNPPSRDRLLDLSTLIPVLAEWMVVLDMPERYAKFRSDVTETIPETNLQMWFPDKTTDEQLYRVNAGIETGATLSSLSLPETLEGLQAHVGRVAATRHAWNELSCLRAGWTSGCLLASRHFRTPLTPALWQEAIPTALAAEPTANGGEPAMPKELQIE